jgi:N-acetylglucosamine-6-phosphate deacetylase
MKALVNCDIYTGSEVLFDHCLVIKDGFIDAIGTHGHVPDNCEVVDLEGNAVAAGFIDLQVNGGGGILFNDEPTASAIRAIESAHSRFGTANWLPTLITAPFETMRAAIDATVQVVREPDSGVIGLHLEGPYLNPERAGVHDKALMRQPNDLELQVLLQTPQNFVRLMSLAPECVPLTVISKLASSGWLISAAHTNAQAPEMSRAIEAGLRCATHIHNAMSPLTSRQPGAVGVAMADGRMSAGIICDGHHVDYLTIAATKNAFSAHRGGKLFLVTDAMPPVGSDIKSFKLGPLEIFVQDDRCVTGEGVLGGSKLDMASAVRRCIQKVGIAKDEALRMASTYPAQYVGLANQLGYIRPGYRANFVVIDNEINVLQTWRNGACVFQDRPG